MSTAATLKALVVLILVMASLLVGAVGLLLARHEGHRWTVAIRHAACGFIGSATLLIAGYGAFIGVQ